MGAPHGRRYPRESNPRSRSRARCVAAPSLSPRHRGRLLLLVRLARWRSGRGGLRGQDLNGDADGYTVLLAAPGFANRITTDSVEASGGQVAQSVVASGDEVTVVFDRRVTPSHQVRVVGLADVSTDWRAVTTTDPRTPQMTIISATQDVSDNELGGDQIVVGFVAGPRMIESDVEDLANWTLTVDGFELDLTGTTIAHDVNSQVATFTLGPDANLHATFGLSAAISTVADNQISQSTVPGAATGDTVAPTLEGVSPVTQDITVETGDEFGHLLIVDFSEPISPVFGATPSNFSVIDRTEAQGLTAVSRVSPDPVDNSVLRITFTRPVVPVSTSSASAVCSMLTATPSRRRRTRSSLDRPCPMASPAWTSRRWRA